MVTPLLDWYREEVAQAECRACGYSGPMAHRVSAAHVFSDRLPVDYSHCPRCGSLNALLDQFVGFDGDEAAGEDAPWIRHYLQVGAGIDSMVRPLQRTRTAPQQTLLDVGCGFGFAVHYWNCSGGQAFGVEPSPYGQLGQQWLDDHILPTYLSQAPQLIGRQFDLVFASEVLEHVADGVGFLEELRRFLNPAGVLVLTTPDAGFIQPTHDVSVVLASLSPGLHRVLFSQTALERLLIQAGFAQVEVVQAGGRLVARAGESLPRPRINPAAEQAEYLRYLLGAAAHNSQPDLQSGLLFRAFKEQVNLGQFEQAATTFQRLRRLVLQQYQLDLSDLAALEARAEQITSFEAFGRCMPYFTAIALFYAGIACLNGANLLEDPRRAFLLSTRLTQRGLSLAPLWFQESVSLYHLSLLHAAMVCLNLGDHGQASQDLQNLLADPTLPAEVALRARREWAVCLLQTGNLGEAMGLLRQLMREAPAMRPDLVRLYRVARHQAWRKRLGWWFAQWRRPYGS